MKHFDLIGTIEIDPILEAIAEHKELWKAATFRQQAVGSAHADTETIYVFMPPKIDHHSIFHSMDIEAWLPDYRIINAIRRMAELVYAVPARAMIVKLKAGGHIKKHIDQGAYAEATDRYHLCITGNDGCEMRIGDESLTLKPEEFSWFDKAAEHECWNRGDTDRIHLIVHFWKD